MRAADVLRDNVNKFGRSGGLMRFAPRLPDRWSKLRFSLTWRGRVLSIEMKKNRTIFSLTRGEPMELFVYGNKFDLGSVPLEVGVSELKVES